MSSVPREFESSETASPEAQMGTNFPSMLPLEDYFQTRHGLILPEELAGAVDLEKV